VRQARTGRLRVNGTGTGHPTQFLHRVDVLRAALEQRLVDRALGLRLARLGEDEEPAWRHPTRGRRQDALAIAVQQRGPGRRVRLGAGGWRCAHGRWNPGDPWHARPRELLPIIRTIAGPIGHQSGGAVGRRPRRAVRLDDLAERWRLPALAAQRVHAHGHPRLRLDHQGPQDLSEVGPMLPTIAARDVHDLCVGGVVAVIAAIDMEAGASERHNARGKAPPLGSRGRHATREFGDARRIERLESPAERLLIERLGFKQTRRQESRDRFILEKPRPQLAWLGHTAEAVEDPRFDGMAGGDDAHLRVVLGRLVNDCAHAEFFTQACDEAQMIQNVAAVDVLSVPCALLCW
jgi:hypothetical protein